MDSSVTKYCRVCLVPEETEKYKNVFDDNATLALEIYKIAGVVLMDVNKEIPSVICQKCIEEIKTVDELKMRILDADEFFSMLPENNEKIFLNVDIKQHLIDTKAAKTPQTKRKLNASRMQVSASKKLNSSRAGSSQKLNTNRASTSEKLNRKLNTSNSIKRKSSSSLTAAIKIKQERNDVENSNPKKKIKLEESPRATPSSLGIQRMAIKAKKTFAAAKSNLSIFFNPKTSSTPGPNLSSKKKKKSFQAGLFNVRPRKRKALQITYECDNCKDTFKSSRALSNHLVVHDYVQPFICAHCEAIFASDDYLSKHIDARHTELF